MPEVVPVVCQLLLNVTYMNACDDVKVRRRQAKLIRCAVKAQASLPRG